MGERYYEVDAIRGIAIILMVIYHIFFCLYFFTNLIPWFNPQLFTGAPGAAVFVGIAGISLVLAHAKPMKYIKRGLFLLVFAIIISIVTWIFYPEGFVVFGILHLIAIGTMLSIPFLSSKIRWYVPLIVGIGVIIAGCFISQIHVPTNLLVPLGFTYPGFQSIDYEPLFPWFGIMLIGITVGKLLYPEGKRNKFMEKFGNMPKILKPICFAGRHTLIIYLVHLPVIILIMMLFGLVSFW